MKFLVTLARILLAMHDFWENSKFCRRLELEVKFFVAKVLPNILQVALFSPVFIAFMIFLVKWSN